MTLNYEELMSMLHLVNKVGFTYTAMPRSEKAYRGTTTRDGINTCIMKISI